MRKVVIKISQGSVVTQTVLGGRHLPVANFLCFITAKNNENWLRVDKVIAMNTVCSFFGPPCRTRTCTNRQRANDFLLIHHSNLNWSYLAPFHLAFRRLKEHGVQWQTWEVETVVTGRKTEPYRFDWVIQDDTRHLVCSTGDKFPACWWEMYSWTQMETGKSTQ